MTTIESYNLHKRVSKAINAMGIKATSVYNKEFEGGNSYEVRVKDASNEEITALLNFVWEAFDNKMINIVSC